MCGSLGHKNPKKALLTHVKPKHKKELSQLVGTQNGSQLLGSNQPLNYHDGKAVYINDCIAL
jgi:hypothetical protein